MDNKYLIDDSSVEGNVKISDEVIETIASVAAEKVEGVVKMQTNLKSQVTDIFSVKNPNRGAKVNVGEKEALVDIYITVEYGRKIVEICKKVQEVVKEAIENMTDLSVMEINVHVTGIAIEKKDKIRV